MIEWIELNKVCRFIDYRGKTPVKTTAGVPLITAKIVKDGKIEQFFEFISESDYSPWMTRGIPKPGDVILTTEAPLGNVAEVPDGKVAFAQRIIVLSPDRTVLNNKYLKYALQSPKIQNELSSRSSGSVVTGIRASELKNVKIPVPPMKVQKKIGAILDSFDSKIELNIKTNNTLESMVKSIFKEWFVDFGPVRSKAEGKKPFGMDDETAALFPKRLEPSIVGDIPSGWNTGGILDLAELISGGTPKTSEKSYWDGNIMWASAKDVSQAGNPFIIKTDRTITEDGLKHSSTKIVPKFSSAVVARGATTGRLTMFGDDMAMNQTCYALKSKTKSPFFLNSLLLFEVPKLVNAAHGSIFDTITTDTFRLSKLAVPPPELIQKFEAMVSPLFQLILSNIKDTDNLEAVKSILLPRLISGELEL